MENVPEIIALILCGGESSRMGNDKFLLNYHKEPQYKHLINLCEEKGISSFISCKPEQANLFGQQINIITDKPEYKNAGPMSGLLSAINKYPEKAIMLLACDYPLFQIKEIDQLIRSYGSGNKTVCFHNNTTNFDEPLLAIYHPKDFSELKSRFNKGETSLRHFLIEADVFRIIPKDSKVLKSFDTPEDFADFTAL